MSQFVGISIWGALVLSSFAALALHSFQPGQSANAPLSQAAAKKPMLIVFAHPECPCTMATIEQLDHIAADCYDHVDLKLVVYLPAKFEEKWTQGRLCQRASSIHGLTIERDEDGRIAKSYGVTTSGQTLLYSREGKLVFSGGITSERGHEGQSDGQDAIENYINEGRITRATAPVFGCSLITEERVPSQ